jgi:hypothetical protein
MQERILGLFDRPPARNARIGDRLAYWTAVVVAVGCLGGLVYVIESW